MNRREMMRPADGKATDWVERTARFVDARNFRPPRDIYFPTEFNRVRSRRESRFVIPPRASRPRVVVPAPSSPAVVARDLCAQRPTSSAFTHGVPSGAPSSGETYKRLRARGKYVLHPPRGSRERVKSSSSGKSRDCWDSRVAFRCDSSLFSARGTRPPLNGDFIGRGRKTL